MENSRASVIGMIHVPALPGTPRSQYSVEEIGQMVVDECRIYKRAGIDSIGLENMHDVPYLNRVIGPEIVAMMTLLAGQVKKESALPCGIQILAGANREALAVAHAAGLDFIRAEGFVFSHVADEGMIDACAGELLRYRKLIGAEQVKIYADIKKKHSSHAITSDVDIAETAKAAEFFLADGVIVTGVATGQSADLDEIRCVKEKVNIPVLVGSGVTLENVDSYKELVDGMIVGSYFKRDGFWSNELDYDRVARFMEKVRG